MLKSEFFIKDYLNKSSSLLKKLHIFQKEISLMSSKLADVIKNDKKIMFCGNGGSAADAQHLSAELIVRLRSNFSRRALPGISLCLDTSTITACGNDIGFSEIFARSLEAIGKEGDALFALSTSGESKNIIKAIETAKKKNIQVFSLTGKDGGKMVDLSDYSIMVPSDITAHIQEAHICLGHLMIHLLEENVINNS